jgi:hypothetical protein
MFEVLTYQTKRTQGGFVSGTVSHRRTGDRRPGGRTTALRRLSSPYSVWPPYKQRFYVNLCTVKHENTSCTFRNPTKSVQESLPVMGCRTSWWSRRDTSIGRVIGFRPKKDVRSGVMVELLHGDRCFSQGELEIENIYAQLSHNSH